MLLNKGDYMDYKTLNQDLIDYLIELDKYFENENIQPVTRGEKKSFELTSSNGRCFFFLDMNRVSTIEAKTTLQTRYATTNDWLIRLDLNCPPHTNPDGTITNRNHIHIIKEIDGKTINIGYNIDEFHLLLIENTKNISKVFEEFCRFCNIKITSNIQLVL